VVIIEIKLLIGTTSAENSFLRGDAARCAFGCVEEKMRTGGETPIHP
jgi:hypothetical protein